MEDALTKTIERADFIKKSGLKLIEVRTFYSFFTFFNIPPTIFLFIDLGVRMDSREAN